MASSNSSGAPLAPSRPLDIDAEVLQMQRMTVNQLRDKYQVVHGEATNNRNKPWLIKRIAWQMQANIYGGISERALARARELAKGMQIRHLPPREKKAVVAPERTKEVACPVRGKRVALPGTMLTREYKGRLLVVKVLPDAFEFEGKTYKSLSAIAKVVTGSHWNGHLFFRVDKEGGAA